MPGPRQGITAPMKIQSSTGRPGRVGHPACASRPARPAPPARSAGLAAAALLASLWLAACSTSPNAPITSPVPGQLSQAVPAAADRTRALPRPSDAGNARDYRRDAARHIYALNAARIYKGKLPPELYAVGSLQVDLAADGRVQSMHWLRAPTQAPEVIAEIERTVLAASPFPAAPKIGPVAWTDTWLWDEGGHFQLDTLSEGQIGQ